MEMFFSTETQIEAYPTYSLICRPVEEALTRLVAASPLDKVALKLAYIPIIMDADGRKRYRARSRLERSQGRFNCCPQLEYEPFAAGDLVRAAEVYIEGMRPCVPALVKLGLAPELAAVFGQILDEVRGA